MNDLEIPVEKTEDDGEAEADGEERGIDRVLDIVEDLYEAVVADIISRSQVVELKRYGDHELTKFRDGRVQILTRRRWVGDREEPLPPTPYELLQLGENPGKLYAPELSAWQKICLMPAIIGSMVPMLDWAGRHFRRRRR